MCRCVTAMMMWAGLFAVFLAAASANSEITVYGKVGDEVALKPEGIAVTGGVFSIMWKDGPNIAIQWDGLDLDRYRHFKERGRLNTTNGVMTITGLTPNDSKVYTPEINNLKGTPIRLIVLSPVPVPTVTKACDEKTKICDLICDGDTTGAEPVNYMWKSDNVIVEGSSGKEYPIAEEHSSNIKEFSCELHNQVSQESSQPIPNPFAATTTAPPESPLKVSTGLTVFLTLLGALLLLVLIHRWKAGMWFFEKASMPWEADFWKKHGRPSTEAAVSNGTAAPEQREQPDEETPMT